ncbi:MAG: GNAT family N-acetyltransferase [Ignavibacteriaceae bacterium]|nr:GNAT family N-acetyltransferase [Ignavibacteriaceae bacterium]
MELNFNPYKIRGIKENDAGKIYEYLQDFDIVKYLATVPSPYLLENARSFIHFAAESETEKKEFHFAIADILNDEMLGLIGVKDIKLEMGTCEIGYWLGKEHHNKGIMTKAIKQIAQFCFTDIGLHTIKAIVFESNIASIKTLEKVGFNNTGYSEKIYCNAILKEKMYEFHLQKENLVSRGT